MNKKTIKKLKNSINECEMKLCSILPHLSKNKPILNRKFNQILIEKAILYDKLKKEKTPFFLRLAEKLNHIRKKECICDYFKS